jgi:phenylalanyl-tRNA synthetase beta chain
MPGGGVVHAAASWITEWMDLPDGAGPDELGAALLRIGLEVEHIRSGADGARGPIVIGRVLSVTAEPQRNGKTISWCSVDVAEPEPRGIVCGAPNVTAGALVVVALPGAVLPGGFEIGARKTYGHISDGMICSARELGIGTDHTGIIVVPADAGAPGVDALDVLGLREAVLTIAVTPDRSHCLSMRGLAREAAAAFGTSFRDVAGAVTVPPADGAGYPVTVRDPVGCDQFSARAVTGLDPAASTPSWMARRLQQSHVRSISLAVDVTNYVMLETGQPLHAFDRAKLSGPLGVRRATAGETLATLDGTVRVLDADDLVVTDDSGPVALAGVMGGASTEIGLSTTDVVLEAAHWQPASISRSVRRHRLPSEAAKRFERGVDPKIAAVALQRCVDLLVEYGGAAAEPGFTVVGDGPPTVTITLRSGKPAEVAGLPIEAKTVVTHLRTVGCKVDGPDGDGADVTASDVLTVRPPSWRPDLRDPADLVEEVVRLVGYETLPSVLPAPPPGTGWTPEQRMRQAVSRALAGAGYSEVLSSPFLSPQVHDTFGLPHDDPRRIAVRLVNPLSDAEPELRTSLLPGLLATLQRNVGRGNRDLALFEMGLVFLPDPSADPAPLPGVDGRPSDEVLAQIAAAVPAQPRHVAVALSGELELPGWWGEGRAGCWADAVEAARTVARAGRAPLEVRAAAQPPWHPGRCAALLLGGTVVGHAGELHPRVVSALGLPFRTAAMELDLSTFEPPSPADAPALSTFPPVLLDVSITVPDDTPAAAVEEVLRTGAGELLESIRLFDAYQDEQLRAGHRKSLAYALRFRAPHRTLTLDEATAARDAAVAAAAVLDGRIRS